MYNFYNDMRNTTYTVRSGDTLYSIAREFNTTVDEIRDLNNLLSNVLKIGQILEIPNSSNDSVTNNYVIYTVKGGDSLYSIARSYNTTVDTLKRINNLTSNLLSIGQKLNIPIDNSESSPPQNFIIYTVKRGDSLYSIAREFDTTVNDLMKTNNLGSTTLSIGQQLLIYTNNNTGQGSGAVEECFGEEFIVPPSTSTYTVVSGDNLYSIARRFNTTVSDLITLNNLTNTNLSIGQVLKLPSFSTTRTYTVVSGDSLYSIANKFDTTVDEIKRLNNLTTNLLSIGQVLKI